MSLYSIETYGELEPHLHQEWLLTNGTGSFAAGTVVNCNTRRYHGRLCAATLPPVGRIMALNRYGEIVLVNGQMHELSINQFGQNFHPRGDRHLRKFELFDGTARWSYEVEGVEIAKELQLVWGRNIAVMRYTINPGRHKSIEFQVLPFVSMRDFHGIRRAWAQFKTTRESQAVMITEKDTTLTIAGDAGEFIHKQDWWFNHRYALESERGLDATEDLFTPGRFVVRVTGKTSLTLTASMDGTRAVDWDAELARRSAAMSALVMPGGSAEMTQTYRRLVHAANDFIVDRSLPDGSKGATIIAGYPWFADWGRDTMISLPGLLLSTRRFAQAKQVLTTFATYVSEGMIPNRFDDYDNHPHYNTVDASLWFIHAVFEYREHSGDEETFARVLEPACRAIVEGYRNGTRYGIKMDEDGLIRQGDAHTQLTWMDAKHGDTAFTPRQGKPVEINALWYHSLVLLGDHALAERVAKSFRQAFWINAFRGLADVVEGLPDDETQPYPMRDTSVRPNQIFAASLPNSALLPEQQAAVVEVVRRELLTPYGLRTLSRDHKNYRGRFTGPANQRDAAYHNGTVWPWLIGHFLDAYLRVNKNSPESVGQAAAWLAPLIESMSHHACIGQLSEVFEADEPHRPVGCPAQAWSVAEVLRLAVTLKI